MFSALLTCRVSGLLSRECSFVLTPGVQGQNGFGERGCFKLFACVGFMWSLHCLSVVFLQDFVVKKTDGQGTVGSAEVQHD